MAHRIGIIGAGIYGLTLGFRLKQALEKTGKPFELTILEKSDRVGGSIGSEQAEGFCMEWGPNGFLNNEPAIFELIRDLGIRDRLVVSQDAARKRYLFINKQLHQIPLSPPGFIKTPILPLTGKLRFALEPLIPQKNDGQDESVAAFVTRRFGKWAVDRMFDPLMSGVYAGNVHTLSIHSTLKVFAEMERDFGGVVKGMFAKIKQRKAEEKNPTAPKVDELLTTSKNPMSGKLLSFQHGMGELIAALHERLAGHIQLSSTVLSIRREDAGYAVSIQTPEGTADRPFDILIMAMPPQQTAPCVDALNGELSRLLGDIPSSTIAVLALGFKAEDIENPLDGFGYLIPRNQKVRSLGVLWSSSIFPNRAPEGHKLLQIMIGGAHDAAAVEEEEQVLLQTAMNDADPVLHFKGQPVVTRIIRHRCGIPQYNIGHRARLAAITAQLETMPGFYLGGNGYLGISTNDCTRTASLLAQQIMEKLSAK